MTQVHEQWDDQASNAQQRYLTHGVFRYFGKLPPTLTGRILGEVGVDTGSRVVDLMAGSGTTIVEAGIRGAEAIGVDCNDLSVLIARVKTGSRYLPAARVVQTSFNEEFGALVALDNAERAATHLSGSSKAARAAEQPAPAIANFSRWFPPSTAICLKILRTWALGFECDRQRDVAALLFASIIRPASAASASAGRVFYDVDKTPPNPFAIMKRPITRLIDGLESLSSHPNWSDSRARMILGDARSVELPDAYADVVFAHPPYFALYRYSSDVLRFELEWLGLPRREIAAREVEDGFKTTNASLSEAHINDILAILKSAARISTANGKLVLVTANSTLRKVPLPIIEGIAAGSRSAGWRLDRRIERRVRFAQASYHRSADSEIIRPSDEILIFERSAN